LDQQRHIQRHSQATSQENTAIPLPPPTNLPTLPKLVKIAYQATKDLSDSQAAYILEQLYGKGFEWGLASDVNVTNPEEPCSFVKVMASPEAPKWLAACTEELNSIKILACSDLFPIMPLLATQ